MRSAKDMDADEQQIRDLIERWAAAVRRGDLEAVVADHDADIVMFDVPPPYRGLRGIDAYRGAWPPFFEWQARGASFAVEELDVTVGGDVAFAYALLRCGTPATEAAAPGNRLRLTLGLRKRDGRWVVTHEHHSFPYSDGQAVGEQEVRQLHEKWFAGTAAGDLDAMMTAVAADVVSYEHEAPLVYRGVDAVREACRRNLDLSAGASVTWDVPDLTILVRDDLAVAWGLNHVRVRPPTGPTSDSWSRGTRVFARRDGQWLMIHQHLSVPVDPETGQAATDLHS